MLTTQQILQQIKLVKPQLQQQFLVKEIALFGSYARTEQQENSDVDLMISMERPSYLNLCRIRYFLERLLPDLHIQVVSKNGIKPAYYEAIKQDLIYA